MGIVDGFMFSIGMLLAIFLAAVVCLIVFLIVMFVNYLKAEAKSRKEIDTDESYSTR